MLRLLLPILVPSWRFFDAIGPAPRIEIAWLTAPTAVPVWRPLHPRPARLGLWPTLARLVWNPHGNAALYLVSRAERLLEAPSPPAVDVFLTRVHQAARRSAPHLDAGATSLQVRIVSTRRDGAQVVDEVTFLSAPWPVAAAADRGAS